jgi:hypothetical protein
MIVQIPEIFIPNSTIVTSQNVVQGNSSVYTNVTTDINGNRYTVERTTPGILTVDRFDDQTQVHSDSSVLSPSISALTTTIPIQKANKLSEYALKQRRYGVFNAFSVLLDTVKSMVFTWKFHTVKT